MYHHIGHKNVDPTELEARFSTEDSLGFLDAVINDTPSEDSIRRLERVQEIMEDLPPREADFVELYFFRHLKQTDIAAIFGVSQPTVCYRLQRAAARIRFLLSLPDIGEPDIREAMSGFLSDPVDVEIMVLMFKTTCQSEVAHILGVSQGLVRHRFMRAIDKMVENETACETHAHETDLTEFRALFQAIASNLNILRDVRRTTGDTVMFALD